MWIYWIDSNIWLLHGWAIIYSLDLSLAWFTAFCISISKIYIFSVESSIRNLHGYCAFCRVPRVSFSPSSKQKGFGKCSSLRLFLHIIGPPMPIETSRWVVNSAQAQLCTIFRLNNCCRRNMFLACNSTRLDLALNLYSHYRAFGVETII